MFLIFLQHNSPIITQLLNHKLSIFIDCFDNLINISFTLYPTPLISTKLAVIMNSRYRIYRKISMSDLIFIKSYLFLCSSYLCILISKHYHKTISPKKQFYLLKSILLHFHQALTKDYNHEIMFLKSMYFLIS